MNIDFPITRTKILVPRRRNEIVTRQRLLDALNELLDNKLMIIAAPAGYGKTSLLIDAIHHSELPFCWYSLDTLDRDPQRFIAHFVASMNMRFPKFGDLAARALNNSSQDHLNIDSLVTTIINDAYENIREHFVVVLDDYHLVRESKQVDHFISRFIQDVDENAHLIIASRTLLTLPDLPLMVARSQVGGISFEELAFRPEEIQSFFEQNYHQAIDKDAAGDIARQTEGWITGLLLSTQMAGKEIENRLRVARVSGVGLYEYLAQQVLLQQPPEVQEFLLRSSLLEEFDAQSCEEVIGKALRLESQPWDDYIEVLLRNNLFILPVGEERIWLRYHHLFRDFLRERMVRERAEEANLIQIRLAEVYMERGEWDQAYGLFQRLGQVESIARLAELAGSSMIVRGRMNTLSEWLESLPPDLRAARPGLLSLLASVTVTRGDTHRGLDLLNQAVQALSQDHHSKAQLALAMTRRSSTRRLLGDYQEALEDAEAVLEMTAGDSSLAGVAAEALRSKGVTLNNQGHLVEALVFLNRSLEQYQALRDEQMAAKVCLDIGAVNESLGSYGASERAYARALEIWQSSGNKMWQANLLNNQGVLQHLMGEYETSAATLQSAVDLAREEGSNPRMEAFALTSIGDLYRDLGAVSEALEAYRWARLITRQIMDRFLLLYLDLAEAGLARAQGQYYQASDLLASACQMAEESQSPYEQSLCKLESGGLKVARKEYAGAVRELEEALTYFRANGYRLEAMRALLYLVIISASLNNSSLALDRLDQLFVLMGSPENRHPLVAAGREVLPQLEILQNRLEIGVQIGEFLDQVREFEERIPQIRRNLRRRAMAISIAPPKMVIRALGRMQVRVKDHVVTGAEWQTQSCRDLFFLVLAHSEGLTKEDVGAIFWPDASSAELKLRFKNNVYRVRHAVGKDAIFFQEDYYYFNRQLDYEYDVESFQREVALGEQAGDPAVKMSHFQASLKYYKGPYLPEIAESWVISERERLRQMYLDVLLKVADLFLKQKQYENAISYCQRALKEDTCLEAAHRLAMRVYAAMGARAALVRQYEECRRALLDEIDAEPSAQTKDLFGALMSK